MSRFWQVWIAWVTGIVAVFLFLILLTVVAAPGNHDSNDKRECLKAGRGYYPVTLPNGATVWACR